MEQPADTLRADQVVLRRWRVTDLDALERAIGESVDHLLPWLPWAAGHSRRQTADFLARSHDQWETGRAFGYAITSGAALIGGCGLHRRIGAGGLDIDRVEIHHDVADPASGAVARRLGFTGSNRRRSRCPLRASRALTSSGA
ncbi:GNAT family N-acetyltransferase [Streptomyces pharetrae]|uniref:GNAT family N-acetyltransferase n=1 Tax=Streptomyces pharetrae TaxID=291370 RepID=UPI0033630CAD